MGAAGEAFFAKAFEIGAEKPGGGGHGLRGGVVGQGGAAKVAIDGGGSNRRASSPWGTRPQGDDGNREGA